MQRSLIVILLAIICGISAAVGVNQLTPSPQNATAVTRPVFVAANSIRRGAKINEVDIKAVDWPANLVPPGAVTVKEDVVGRAALSGITPDEPFMQHKLSDGSGSGFASNTIPAGMRACSIQTSGASASVATFVRPGDKVDVLLNLRESTQGESGGGSTITLLQSAEILAIDDIMDVDADAIKLWMKEGVNSVTLLVTPEQAMLISLGQSVGTMGLSLRNGDDPAFITDTRPVTINQIRNMPAASTYPLQDLLKILGGVKNDDDADPELSGDVASGLTDSSTQGSSTSTSIATGTSDDDVQRSGSGNAMRPTEKLVSVDREPNRPSFIFTLRGNQSGMVRVLELGEDSP